MATDTPAEPTGVKLLFLTLLANGAAASSITAWDAIYYSQRPFYWIGAMMWLVPAVVGLAGAWCVWKRQPSWRGLSLASSLATVLLSAYLLVLEWRSPQLNYVIVAICVLFLVVNIVWLFLCLPVAPRAIGKGWGAVAALFPLLGLAQWWLQTDYLPRHERPLIDMQATLEEVGRSEGKAHLRGTIVFENQGPVHAAHLGSLWELRGERGDVAAEGEDLDGAIDWLYPNSNRFERGEKSTDGVLLGMDEIFSAEEFLLPGARSRREFLVTVDVTEFDSVQLTADAAFMNAERLGAVVACHSPEMSRLDKDFFREVRRPVESEAGGRFLCIERGLYPRTGAHAIVADAPAVRTYIVLDDPEESHLRPPYLLTVFGVSGSFESEDVLKTHKEAQRIDAQAPSILYRARTEHSMWEPNGSPPSEEP